MKIQVIAIGSRGDIQPLIALALGLKRAGHQVTVVTHQTFRELVGDYQLEFKPLTTDVKAVLGGAAGQSAMSSGANPIVGAKKFADMFKPVIKQMGDECAAICQSADLLIYSTLAIFVVPHIAHAQKIPAIAALFQPFHPTTEFPSFSIPNIVSFGGLLNRASYMLTDALFWWPFKQTVLHWLQDQSMEPAFAQGKNFYKQWLASAPVVYGFSPQVIKRPPQWPASASIAGYWFLDSPQSWQPPQALLDFLAVGPKPIYVGFGSMVSSDPKATARKIIAALRETKQRAIVASGWGGVDAQSLPDSIFAVEAIPHDWLFPRMAAAIHHGGAGTTAAAIRAGIPSIVMPFYVDQPFWGNLVYKLKIGSAPISHNHLTTEKLVRAIQMVTTRADIRDNAARLGRQVQQEDGVARAVETIHQILGLPEPTHTPAPG